MEAIIARASVYGLDSAVTVWLRATRRLVRAAARAAGESLVATSRAGLLVRNGSRPHRRL